MQQRLGAIVRGQLLLLAVQQSGMLQRSVA